jgi:hypothetical protein
MAEEKGIAFPALFRCHTQHWDGKKLRKPGYRKKVDEKEYEAAVEMGEDSKRRPASPLLCHYSLIAEGSGVQAEAEITPDPTEVLADNILKEKEAMAGGEPPGQNTGPAEDEEAPVGETEATEEEGFAVDAQDGVGEPANEAPEDNAPEEPAAWPAITGAPKKGDGKKHGKKGGQHKK